MQSIDRCACGLVMAFRSFICKPDAGYRKARETLASQSAEPLRLQIYCPIFRKSLGFGSQQLFFQWLLTLQLFILGSAFETSFDSYVSFETSNLSCLAV